MRARLVCTVVIAACGNDPGAPPDTSVEHAGIYGAATTHWQFTDDARARSLTVQAFYPTDALATTVAASELETAANQASYAALLAAAPSCPTRTLELAVDAPPSAGTFPVILFSHCHSCTRLSGATISARLASHGFVVLAVDHAGDDLWDHLAMHDGPLTSDELEVRAADVRAVLDDLASGAVPLVGASADLAHVGVFGHSFGAVTAGRVAELDARITSAAALCSPMENPLITGVTLANIMKPLLFMVAIEDNSITEFGNKFIRDNYTAAPGPAWKLEVPDAGHFSVSDLDGLVDVFAAGCGAGLRQTDGSPFTYLDPPTGRDLAASFVTAFFRATLAADDGARAYLDATKTAFTVQAQHHE